MSRTLTRANSDLLNVKLIADNNALSAIERMELIAAVVADYSRAVGNMPDAHGARARMTDRNHLGQRRESEREWIGTRLCRDDTCTAHSGARHSHKVYAD